MQFFLSFFLSIVLPSIMIELDIPRFVHDAHDALVINIWCMWMTCGVKKKAGNWALALSMWQRFSFFLFLLSGIWKEEISFSHNKYLHKKLKSKEKHFFMFFFFFFLKSKKIKSKQEKKRDKENIVSWEVLKIRCITLWYL